jgi:hypothetical protein
MDSNNDSREARLRKMLKAREDSLADAIEMLKSLDEEGALDEDGESKKPELVH